MNEPTVGRLLIPTHVADEIKKQRKAQRPLGLALARSAAAAPSKDKSYQKWLRGSPRQIKMRRKGKK